MWKLQLALTKGFNFALFVLSTANEIVDGMKNGNSNLIGLMRLAVFSIAIVILFGCSVEPINLFGIHEISLQDYAGCYRTRERRYAGFDGVLAWWNVKNICFDGSGNWIESNGLNIKHGKMKTPHDNSFDFELETDTLSFVPSLDPMQGRASYTFEGYEYYNKSIVSIIIDKSNANGFEIYGKSASPLSCWEFPLPSDTFALWRGSNIKKPNYCPQELADIIGASGWQTKTE